MGRAPSQGRDHVMQRGSPQRSDQTDAARQYGQWPLAGRVEQAFGLQLGLQALELLEQGALPGPRQAFHDQLQVAAWLIDAQPALDFDHVAIARGKVQQAGRAAEHGAANLALAVLEREIAMPAGCARKARNLAAHRDRIESRIQSLSNGAA